MTSSPLFISVLESTVIFGPMLHVGWARAASTVTSASSAAERPRNGPPLAVSSSRCTSRSAATDDRRHWWSAQCSLSTGTSSAPGRARSGCTTGPAAIRLSLFASASRLPARNVSIVIASPANPTTPFTTTSAPSTTAASSATTSVDGSAAATRCRASSSATATSAGDHRRACSTRASADRPTASDTTSYEPGTRSFSAAITSRVCVPIEPVEPAMATRVVADEFTTTGAARWATSEFEPRLDHQHQVVHRRKSEEEPVEAIEDAAVTADDRTEVLHVEVALEHALGEIPERRQRRDHDAQHQQMAGARPGVAQTL